MKTPEEIAAEAVAEYTDHVAEWCHNEDVISKPILKDYILSAIQAATGELEREVTDLEVRLAACHNQMTNDANGILADSKRITELKAKLKPFAGMNRYLVGLSADDTICITEGRYLRVEMFHAAAETLEDGHITPSPGREDK